MCGFVGLIGRAPAAPGLVLGLQAIQHRGQDAAGIATIDGARWHLHKDLGMVTQAITAEAVAGMGGHTGIGHVRYPTAGGAPSRQDAQPFLTRRPGMLLAHNGNLTNVPEVCEALAAQGLHVLSECDAEPLLLVLAQELTKVRPAGHTSEDLRLAVQALYSRVRGAFSVVLAMHLDGEETLVAFRDPSGIRPGVYGRRESDGAWMVASESVALDVLGFRKQADIPAGEILLFRADQDVVRLPVQETAARPCVFERIYFARPDSVMEDGRVNRQRWRMGRQLAREWREKGLEADVVVAIPDTSRPAAMAMAEELRIANREGFIKNRYSGRTFIMPDAATRKAALRLKLNPIREIFAGQRVLLVDDSIVRGTTMGRIVDMLRDLEPEALHVAVFSPPVRHPCFYGIDMPSQSELVAAQHAPAEVESALCEKIGADSLTYLSLEGLSTVMGEQVCAACFDGEYCVPVSERERAAIYAERRP
jgi:amidophosphoribosyltransferase